MKTFYAFTILLVFQFQLNAQCVEPSNVYIETNMLGYSPHITWTENGTATMWDIEYDYTGFYPTGIPTEEDLTETFFYLDELDTATYDFYVRADCGSEQSDRAGPFTFYKYCIGASFTDFDDDFLPLCWSQADQGSPSDEPSHFGFGTWEQSNFANSGGNLAAKIHIDGIAVNDWLISPLLPKVYPIKTEWFGINIDFTIALTQHNAADAASLGSDDQIQLVYSLDYGRTWQHIRTWDSSSSISSTGDYISIYEEGYSNSELLLIAFWVSSGVIDDVEDVDFFIDHIEIGHYGAGSIGELQSKGFSFFPNPINNNLSIRANESINRIILYDLMGKRIVSKNINAMQSQIDLTAIEKGLFFMQVYIGDTVGSVKLVKE